MKSLFTVFLAIFIAYSVNAQQSINKTSNRESKSEIIIGTETNLKYYPVYPLADFTYSQSIYLQSEIGAITNIDKISYYNNGGALNNSNTWTIYIGHTTKTSFSTTTDWIPVSALTQVYSATFPASSTTSTPGWIDFDITDFAYNGSDNLVIAIDENTSSYNGLSSSQFHASAVTGNRSMAYYSLAGVNPDPNSPPTANKKEAFIPNIKLTLIQSATTDFGVSNLVLPQQPIAVGLTSISVTFQNLGTTNLTTSIDVTFKANGTIIGTVSTGLVNAGDSKTITYNWNATVGYYDFEVSIPADAVLSNNTITENYVGIGTLHECFENSNPPTGWIASSGWQYLTTTAYHGLKCAGLIVGINPTGTLVTPQVNVTGDFPLKFCLKKLNTAPIASIKISYSTNSVGPWTDLSTFDATTSWTQYTQLLNSITPGLYYFQLTGNTSEYLYLDHIEGPEIYINPSTETNFENFSFNSLNPNVTGIINSTYNTVNLIVPYNTDVTSLVSTFTISLGAHVKVGVNDQISGTTANNFTNPVIYTITNGLNTQNWTVTVIVQNAPLILEVSGTLLNIASIQNSTATFDIISNTTWNVNSDQSWLSPSVTSGANNSTITLTASENTTTEIRTASITVSGSGVSPSIITVMQDADVSFVENVANIINIYPNPSSGVFTIVQKSNDKFKYEVTNLSGKIILIGFSQNETEIINLNNFSSGIYFVSIKLNNNNIIHYKITKE